MKCRCELMGHTLFWAHWLLRYGQTSSTDLFRTLLSIPGAKMLKPRKSDLRNARPELHELDTSTIPSSIARAMLYHNSSHFAKRACFQTPGCSSHYYWRKPPHPDFMLFLWNCIRKGRLKIDKKNALCFENTPSRIPTSSTCIPEFFFDRSINISSQKSMEHFLLRDLILWPMTLTYVLALDILPLDIHAEIQVCMSIR